MQFQDYMRDEYFKRKLGGALPQLLFAGTVLACLLSVRYVFLPQWQVLAAHKTSLSHLYNALESEQGAGLKNHLLAKRDTLRSRALAISGENGQSCDLPAILRILLKKANAADIQFVKMVPQSEMTAGASTACPIILEMTASYHSLGRFVASLESLPRLIHVDRLSLSLNKKNLLDAKILITCFIGNKGQANE